MGGGMQMVKEREWREMKCSGMGWKGKAGSQRKDWKVIKRQNGLETKLRIGKRRKNKGG